MNRRRFLLATAAFTLLSTTAARADYVEDIVKWLQKEGYAVTDVARTLLGRVQIRATKDGGHRELVCNPRTGEILRDIWIDANGNTQTMTSSPETGRHSGDDDEEDVDDDNSGHGGGDDDNSGHGGGDDDDDTGSGDSSGHGSGQD